MGMGKGDGKPATLFKQDTKQTGGGPTNLERMGLGTGMGIAGC